MSTVTTATNATATAEPQTNPLTKHDRCDSCNAQAFVRATSVKGVLTFCGHHGNAHFDALIAQGFIVEDYRAFINKEASASSA